MSRPLTPKEMQAAADEARAEAKRERAEAELRAMALELLAEELEEAVRRGLTIDADHAKVRRMSQSDLVSELAKSRKVGRPITGKHAVQRALKAKGMTLSELARLLGKERNTVKSWLVQSIPMAQAKRIEDILGVPATLASYPAGIRQ